ncbi:Zinc finger protein dzip1l [Physocladia obscura]|uniref:Zinc finger protein dzip1l n=1 Tax=Physocladia obscura TaxID=109957 RepID=A0AAD5XD04_9FUNG|nr:Zinc finger protein dzip1l [Physocladia obscura]
MQEKTHRSDPSLHRAPRIHKRHSAQNILEDKPINFNSNIKQRQIPEISNKPKYSCDSYKENNPVETNPRKSSNGSFVEQPESYDRFSCRYSKYNSALGNNIINTTGFYFKKRSERLDWRLLASIQVDRVQREVSKCLDLTITTAKLTDLRFVDPNFIKLFKISQLIIEYLVHTQDMLSSNQIAASKDLTEATDKLELVTKTLEKQNLDFQAIKKENKSLKKALYAYQLMARVPGYITSADSNEAASYHRCFHCTKVFKAHSFLQSHIERRHPEHSHPSFQNSQLPHSQANLCNFPPQIYQSSHGHHAFQKESGDTVLLENLKDTIENLKMKMKHSEEQLRREMEEQSKNNFEKALQDKYEQERLKNENEIQTLKSSIHQQLSDERAALEEEKLTLQEIIKEAQKNAQKSRLGALEDDDEEKREDLKPVIGEIEQKQISAISEMTAKLDEQLLLMKNMFVAADASEKDKKNLESRLERTTQQISALHEALKLEHRLNESRDKDFKSFISKSKQKQSQCETSQFIATPLTIGGGNIKQFKVLEEAQSPQPTQINFEDIAVTTIETLAGKRDGNPNNTLVNNVLEIAQAILGDNINAKNMEEPPLPEKVANVESLLVSKSSENCESSKTSTTDSSENRPLTTLKPELVSLGSGVSII